MRVGRGQKMKVPESDPIISGMCSGVAHEVQRAPNEVWKRSYARHQLPSACAEGGTDASLSAVSGTHKSTKSNETNEISLI